RGIHRHVVRFVNYDGTLYALKELPDRIAEREYRLLRRLADEEIPVVTVIGIVSGRSTGDGVPGTAPRASDEELSGVLITRHLEFSLPYRTLFTGHSIPRLRDRLLDALAELLVRLHLANVFWGDCSLSNTLFRRDAGELEAYLVDAETGEIHPTLSDQMRRYDIDIAEENVAGELMDVQAGYGLPDEIDPVETAGSLRRRYESLWTELTHEETFGPDERYKIDARLRRLNDLGFDVDEMELITTPEGYRLRMHTQVVEPGHHRRRLMILTGLDVQENQARRLLYDIDSFRQAIERKEGRPLPESVVAYRWLGEVFEPTIAAIPDEMRGKLQPAEIYHQVLEHRWFMSESEDKDVGLRRAVRSYINDVLRHVPDEAHVLTDEDDDAPDEPNDLTEPAESPPGVLNTQEPADGR
ncbi:MAG TPA: DUF4032 domain-containing protein, partial [Thermomicrobiales bacterium]|nr:DUF4032 domain-containing protein [Thermomicrobiales bacterium]